MTTGEKCIVVCIQPADIYAERKAWNHSGTVGRVAAMHQALFDEATTAYASYSLLARAYVAFAPSDAESVVKGVSAFVNRCADEPDLPDTAVGVSLGTDPHGTNADWRPSLCSEAACIADALADIARTNQVLTDGAFRSLPMIADDDHLVAAPTEVIDRVIVALARRLEVAVLNTCATSTNAPVANYPVLRPYLKAIEDKVTALLTGSLGDAASFLPDIAEGGKGKVKPFGQYLSRMRYVERVLREIDEIFSTTDLQSETPLTAHAHELRCESRDLVEALEVRLNTNKYLASVGAFDALYQSLLAFSGELSCRIQEGDAVRGNPPFFLDLASTWK